MDKKLDLILKQLEKLDVIEQEFQSVKQDLHTLKKGQKELYEIVNAIHHRQEETDAKFEALSMEVHKISGELKRIEQKVDENHKELLNEIKDIKLDLDFTYQKTTLNERELHKLKNKQ